MDKQQAQRIIKETFENSFDRGKFIYFIKNLLNSIEEKTFIYRGNFIPDAYKQYIGTLERIGEYTDGKNMIDILIVKLKKENSIERARTMQRNFISWYLNGSRGDKLKDAALVAFISPSEDDWRFSLVKMDYKFEESKNGKVKVKEKFTPACRWSFLVGKNEKSHTAQSRFVPMLADDRNNPTLEQLGNAFNIEKVTKEFFKKYRGLFLWAKDEMDKIVSKNPKIKDDFEYKGINTVDFTKKLLGQIIFLYFLQKKGWFGVKRDASWGTGPKNFLRELYEGKHGSYNNFFNDILEPLFYEALARERDDNFYSRFNCKIPFLNGGLFDPINNYDWVHIDILLPNELFSNSNKTKEGDIGNGILDIFDRYNFTVKEDEPLEKEVAIDPEMLGKAYEKFNAIRQDNYEKFKEALKSGKKGEENKFNKKFGVYYTPREIVHYMCQQSLINYLATELDGKICKEDIETLIQVGERIGENEAVALAKNKNISDGKQKTSVYKLKLTESIRKNAKLIDGKLADITVCDPAVGSGAFPVGMMSEIVRARNVLSNYIQDENRTPYGFKRWCIEHSLYGVDIDPGAVEIAKLRLWLSLIVDEDDIKNIKPLPNLDYRIMQGNSLISEFMGINFDVEKEGHAKNPMFRDETDELTEQFQKKKAEFLNESDVTRKSKLKKEVENLLIKIFETKLRMQKADYFDHLNDIENKYSFLQNGKRREELIKQDKEKLYKKFGFNLESVEKQLKEFTSGRKVKPFFLWKLYFSEIFYNKGGFDVVIANPPYGAELNKEERIFLDQRFAKNKSIVKNSAIYFTYKAIELLRNSGVHTYIVPKSLCYSMGWNKCASVVLQGLQKLIDTGKAFEEVKLEQVIFVRVNENQYSDYVNGLYDGYKVREFTKVSKDIFENSNVLLTGQTLEELNLIYRIIEKFSSKWGDYVSIERGLNWQSKATKKHGTVPIYRGAQLSPYFLGKPTDFINISKFERNEYNYQFKPKILNQLAIAHVQNPHPHFYLQVTLDLESKLVFETISCTFLKNSSVSIKFLLAINNSKLFAWLLYKFVYSNAIRSTRYDEQYIAKVPCPNFKKINQKPIIQIVDQILAITQKDDYNPKGNTEDNKRVKQLECQIDQLVYKLYDLTPEEIKIVEGNLEVRQ